MGTVEGSVRHAEYCDEISEPASVRPIVAMLCTVANCSGHIDRAQFVRLSHPVDVVISSARRDEIRATPWIRLILHQRVGPTQRSELPFATPVVTYATSLIGHGET